MKVDTEKDKVYYKEYDPIALKHTIETQHKVIHFQKKNKQKELFSILTVVDDFADDPKIARYSNMLHGFFTRGRHNAISCILSTQKYNVFAPIISLSASALFIFRLKNMKEVNSFLEENSALVDRQTVYDMYQQAVNFAPYSFFCINTNAKDVNNMFYINSEQHFVHLVFDLFVHLKKALYNNLEKSISFSISSVLRLIFAISLQL